MYHRLQLLLLIDCCFRPHAGILELQIGCQEQKERKEGSGMKAAKSIFLPTEAPKGLLLLGKGIGRQAKRAFKGSRTPTATTS